MALLLALINGQAGAAADANPERNAWSRGLANAGQLRETLDRARARPESGGLLFAARVSAQCGRADVLADAQAQRLRAGTTLLAQPSVEALSRLQQLCSTLTPDERQLTRQLRIISASDGAGAGSYAGHDPFLVALQALRRAGAPRDQVVKQALEHFDPAHLDLLLLPQGERIWFDGQWFDLGGTGRDGEALLYAKALAECEFGVPCDGSDMEIALRCAMDVTFCGARSRSDLLRRIIADDGLPAAIHHRASALATRIVAAVKRKQVTAFVPR